MTAYDALADLLVYPIEPPEARAFAYATSVRGSNEAVAAGLERFALCIAGRPLAALQEEYTSTFDLGSACALELGWHLFGETCDRGGFLATLREDLRRLGIAEHAGLPDHLSHVLALIAREEPGRAAALARRVAPAIGTVRNALAARNSSYVHLLDAAQRLVGEQAARLVPERSTP